uniref:Protease Do-like PDZ domain-containing protein n=1 Tax=Aureoumbra lagunensis TaxID=44058 RepID=A0A7S3JXR5_9STRA
MNYKYKKKKIKKKISDFSQGLKMAHKQNKAGTLDRAIPVNESLERALGACVKVYVTCVEPDYTQPWSVFLEEECTGSGFVVRLSEEKLVIVTNQHVVASATEIRLRKYGGVQKYRAMLALSAHTADLALLDVEDANFWKDMAPLKLGALPRLYENVVCLGFSFPGENACVTRGIVSRVDTMSYVRGAEELLVLQVDSAVNSGNSGGPALDDSGCVAGVAFSSYAGSADNIGYVIPTAIVHNVLNDYLSLLSTIHQAAKKKKKLRWAGLCNLGLGVQTCENPAFRKRKQMSLDQTGVCINRVARLGCGHAAGICVGDILLSIDSIAVANDGTVPLRNSERVGCEHLISSKRIGTQISLQILRDGIPLNLHVTLSPLPRLVPLCDGFDAAPSYVIIAGLVFMSLSAPLLSALSDDDDDDDDDDTENKVDLRYLADVLDADKADPETQIVVWTQIISHDVNHGYNGLCRRLPRLRALNGTPVINLAHLAFLAGFGSRKLKSNDTTPPQNEFLEFDFISATGCANTTVVVIDTKLALAAEKDILRRSKIPEPFSYDLGPLLRKYQLPLPKEEPEQPEEKTEQQPAPNHSTPDTTDQPPPDQPSDNKKTTKKNNRKKSRSRRNQNQNNNNNNNNNEESAHA